MKKRGFNLSEVLTVLMVVGVIAAMVLPVTIKNINEQKTLSMIKKLYASYTINIQTVLNEAGCDSLSCLRAWGNDETQTNDKGEEEAIPPTEHNGVFADTRYFNVRNVCTNCFSNVVLPNGVTTDNSTAYILDDNTYALIKDFTNNCSTNNVVFVNNSGVNSGVDSCGILIFDVNGGKLPNIPGKDIFGFYISDERLNGSFLVPFGLDGTKSDKNYDSVKSVLNNAEGENAIDVTGYNVTGKLYENDWKNSK